MHWQIEPKHVQMQSLKDPAPVCIQMQRIFRTITLAKSIFLSGGVFLGELFWNPEQHETQLNNPLHVSLGVRRVKSKPKVQTLEFWWHSCHALTFEHGLSINKHKSATRPSPMLFEEPVTHLSLGHTPMPNFLFSKQHYPLYPPSFEAITHFKK